MQIQILTVTPSQAPAKTPGKTYSKLEVAFKNLTFQGKIEGKSLVGFGSNKPAYDVLINAQPGDVYEIEIVKENGYNQWVNAKKGDGSASAPTSRPASSAPTSSGTTSAAAPRSNYETPEERAKRQIYIVRQSSISSAVELLSVGAKSAPDVDKVLETASRFESFVFGEQVSSEQAADSFFPDSPKKQSADFPTDDDIPF